MKFPEQLNPFRIFRSKAVDAPARTHLEASRFRTDFDSTADRSLLDALYELDTSILQNVSNEELIPVIQKVIDACAQKGMIYSESSPLGVTLPEATADNDFYRDVAEKIGPYLGAAVHAIKHEKAGEASPTNLRSAAKGLLKVFARTSKTLKTQLVSTRFN